MQNIAAKGNCFAYSWTLSTFKSPPSRSRSLNVWLPHGIREGAPWLTVLLEGPGVWVPCRGTVFRTGGAVPDIIDFLDAFYLGCRGF